MRIRIKFSENERPLYEKLIAVISKSIKIARLHGPEEKKDSFEARLTIGD